MGLLLKGCTCLLLYHNRMLITHTCMDLYPVPEILQKRQEVAEESSDRAEE